MLRRMMRQSLERKKINVYYIPLDMKRLIKSRETDIR